MTLKKSKRFQENLPKIMFIFSILFAVFMYGFFTRHFEIFPYSHFRDAFRYAYQLKNKTTGQKEWFYHPASPERNVMIYNNEKAYDGPTLYAYLQDNNRLGVSIVDMSGERIHHWDIDWFKIWPDCDHIPEEEKPVAQPGTHVHGIVILENGDIVFNFEHMGLVRLDVCGNVVWKLPYRTHHSVYMDENKTLWVSAQINHTEWMDGYPNLRPLIIEPVVIQVSLDGEILREIPIIDLLTKNNYEGLLYLSTIANKNTRVGGDILHLNDVETFPSDMPEGFFKHGDILISLRNINTILVIDDQEKIKFISTGKFVRHHDPDFVDGNTISVFDNNNRAPVQTNPQSKILMVNAETGKESVFFEGSPELPFYTKIMGCHQWLPNGNVLITESVKGHVFELTPDKELVWDFYNIVNPEYLGVVEDAIRLPAKYNKAFFQKQVALCEGK